MQKEFTTTIDIVEEEKVYLLKKKGVYKMILLKKVI